MPADKRAQIEYYNTMWDEVSYANILQLERCSAILEEIRALGIAQPKICDLGCGTGWLTEILGTFGVAVGVEMSDVAVDKARRRFLNATFVCSDILEWRPVDAFDLVVSQEVIEHFDDQSEYLSVAHEILRPGGHIILTTPNLRTVNAAPKEHRSNQPIENWLTRVRLHELMCRHFSDVRIRSIILGYGSKGSYRIVNSRRFESLFRRIRLNELWRNIALFCDYGLHFVVTGVKKG